MQMITLYPWLGYLHGSAMGNVAVFNSETSSQFFETFTFYANLLGVLQPPDPLLLHTPLSNQIVIHFEFFMNACKCWSYCYVVYLSQPCSLLIYCVLFCANVVNEV